MVNNSKEAKSCQISQEKRQLKNNTHSQYVKQFRDMVERNVVSELTQADMSAYTGPINYITHHEVCKPGSVLVSNSSFMNGITDFNEITVKGPNTLADIYNNLFSSEAIKWLYECGPSNMIKE